MSAYMVISITPSDEEKFREYESRTGELVRRHGGVLIARDSEPFVVESDETPAYGVILKWPSKAAMRAYWDSPEYQPIKEFRHTFAEASAIVIED